MTNRKVCNVITSTSLAQVCYTCHLRKININDDTVRRPVDITFLVFGLSTLHA